MLKNKYTKWYYSIINNARQEKRIKSDKKYLEKHHIIPKSLGGSNDDDNIILLTFKEHYMCHRLLCKMYNDSKSKNKMYYALYNLSRSNDKQIRNLTFKQKMICLEANRSASKTRHHKPNLGNKHSEETRKKISESNIGRKHSKETIEKISKTQKNKPKPSVSRALRGKSKSLEHRKRISESIKSSWNKKRNLVEA